MKMTELLSGEATLPFSTLPPFSMGLFPPIAVNYFFIRQSNHGRAVLPMHVIKQTCINPF